MTQESLSPEEYQRQYDAAAAQLDAAAGTAPAITARDEEGKFAKAETPATEPEAIAEPAAEQVAPAAETTAPVEQPAPDPLAELTARVERAEKIAKDNQAWATRMAQEAAALRRQQDAEKREASKPTILDANPELADAIRYIASDPAPQEQAAAKAASFQATIEQVHADAFSVDMPAELQDAIAQAWTALGDKAQDPLNVVRVITEEKLAFTERQIGKRFAAEQAKLQQKSAMSVPTAGAQSVQLAPIDAQLAEAQRIAKMTPREFEAEARRVRGY